MAKPFQFRLRILLLAVMPVSLTALALGYHLRRPIEPQLVRASGIVTLDGAPVEFARVGVEGKQGRVEEQPRDDGPKDLFGQALPPKQKRLF